MKICDICPICVCIHVGVTFVYRYMCICKYCIHYYLIYYFYHRNPQKCFDGISLR